MGDSPRNFVHGAPWLSQDLQNRSRSSTDPMGHYLGPNVAMVNGLPNIRPNPPASGHCGLVGYPLPRPPSPPLRHHRRHHQHHHFGGSGRPRMQSTSPIACYLSPSPLSPASSPPHTRNLISGCFSFYRRRNHQRSSWGGGTGFFLPRVTSSPEGSSSGTIDWGKAPAVPPLPPPPLPLPVPAPAVSSTRRRKKNKTKALAEVSKDEDSARVEEQDKSELSPEDFLPKEWEY